jgi:hypothetical protein
MKKYSIFLNENMPYEGNDWILDEDFGEEEISEGQKTGKLSDMLDDQHKLYRQNEHEAGEWHKAHPVHHMNVMEHFNKATPEEKHNGMNWYKDAHHVAKAIAKDTKTEVHTMAGLISNYSPQTHWATNMMTASTVARHKKAMGGPGSGVFADGRQKAAAHQLLEGKHYDKVLAGNKTRAFAHLIEHGGNADPKSPRVVIDRHAYSVAAGSRLTDAAFTKTNLKSKKGYEHVADTYHKAAKHLSEQHGETIHPHQVQATTWLVRQRLNADEETAKKKSSSTKKSGQVAKANWDSYAAEHHPSVVGKEPGTGYD